MRSFVKQIILMNLALLCLCSCKEATFRINKIEAGIFVGVDTTETYTCTLKVDAIDKGDYEKAEGFNVVHDVVGGGYYRLSFDAVGDDAIIHYDFLSLVDPYKGAPKTFAMYMDDNNSTIKPWDPHFPTETNQEHVSYNLGLNCADDLRIVVTGMKWAE